ncbi:hypothetical protein [Kitasatospora sp. NPDC094011]|uniref:hypothetical protein n=1 Tax=Kitasatospora sp. NPDC094011 TaxID=3364090 RepID=UPI003823FA67
MILTAPREAESDRAREWAEEKIEGEFVVPGRAARWEADRAVALHDLFRSLGVRIPVDSPATDAIQQGRGAG